MNEPSWLWRFMFVPGYAGPIWILVGVGIGVLLSMKWPTRRR